MIVVIIFTATKSTIVSVRTLRAIEKAQNICNIGGYSQSGGVALLGFLSVPNWSFFITDPSSVNSSNSTSFVRWLIIVCFLSNDIHNWLYSVFNIRFSCLFCYLRKTSH